MTHLRLSFRFHASTSIVLWDLELIREVFSTNFHGMLSIDLHAASNTLQIEGFGISFEVEQIPFSFAIPPRIIFIIQN
jgi:hypothetical protein